MARTVLLIGTLDTKGAEVGYVRDLLQAHGVVLHQREVLFEPRAQLLESVVRVVE